MKKFLVIAVAVALFVAVGSNVFAAGGKEAGKPKVAGVVFQEDQFMKLLQLGYKDAARRQASTSIPATPTATPPRNPSS
jgi:hypothetical protein